VRAGLLDKRVVIEAPPTSQDTFGGPTGTWTTVATRWASIVPLQGREYHEARQHAAAVDHRITLRYLPGIAPKQRVRYGARLFDIEAVINVDEAGRELQLMAKERL
jgi:SPP1 family predicted phage head-tail adaptor